MGARNELYGESIEACVVLNDSFLNEDIDGSDILAKIKGKISSFKMPSHVFIFKNFPVNSNGKFDSCKLYVEMLDRLNSAVINDDIKSGIEIVSLQFKKQYYVISTITKTSDEILKLVGFDDVIKRNKIILCIEEMLNEIVNKYYVESGSAKIAYVLFNEFLRISFENESDKILFDGKYDSLSVKIITGCVDRISKEDLGEGKTRYNLDFTFSKDYNPKVYFTKNNLVGID